MGGVVVAASGGVGGSADSTTNHLMCCLPCLVESLQLDGAEKLLSGSHLSPLAAASPQSCGAADDDGHSRELRSDVDAPALGRHIKSPAFLNPNHKKRSASGLPLRSRCRLVGVFPRRNSARLESHGTGNGFAS